MKLIISSLLLLLGASSVAGTIELPGSVNQDSASDGAVRALGSEDDVMEVRPVMMSFITDGSEPVEMTPAELQIIEMTFLIATNEVLAKYALDPETKDDLKLSKVSILEENGFAVPDEANPGIFDDSSDEDDEGNSSGRRLKYYANSWEKCMDKGWKWCKTREPPVKTYQRNFWTDMYHISCRMCSPWRRMLKEATTPLLDAESIADWKEDALKLRTAHFSAASSTDVGGLRALKKKNRGRHGSKRLREWENTWCDILQQFEGFEYTGACFIEYFDAEIDTVIDQDEE